MKKLFSILLIFLMLVGCDKTGNPDKISLPEYVRPDEELIVEHIDIFNKAIEEGDKDKCFEYYEILLDDYRNIGDMYRSANLQFYLDSSNEFYSEEETVTSAMATELGDKMLVSICDLCHSSLAEDFKAYLNNDDYFEAYFEYEGLNEETIEISKVEDELVVEYLALDESDPDFYDKAADIYIKLIGIHRRKAELEGYDSYEQYCYEYVYERDYSEEDLVTLKNVIRDISALDCYALAYYMTYEYSPVYKKANKNIFKDFKGLALKISSKTEEPLNYMLDNELCFLTDSKNSIEAGFTTTTFKDQIPFMYIRKNGKARDFKTLTHEFGHYVNFYYHKNDNPFMSADNLDLCEIHSNGFSALCAYYAEDIFGEEADGFKGLVLSEMLYSIASSVIYDEFERRAHLKDDWTKDELIAVFKEISDDLGYESDGTEWMNIPHLFQSPFYYISYATSCFAALQIYDLSLEDFDKALCVWEKLIDEGAYDKKYLEVIEDAGLRGFEDQDFVDEVVNDMYDLCVDYLRACINR